MADIWSTSANTIFGPAEHAAAVVLTGDTDCSGQPTRAIIVGTSGNIKVDTIGGEIGVILASVPAGLLPIRVTKIYSTANGTTASNLSILW